MARSISEFANSTYGIGITGKLNRADEANNYGLDNEVFVSIYKNGKYYDLTKVVNKSTREENKQLIIDDIIQELGRVINEENK
jgi:nicotinamide mononucleotide (NMN) deamidase PncC